MKATFYGGVNEIGGNKTLLEYKDTRIFLDFGKSYKRENEYFEFPLIQPTNIGDLLKTGVIPELNGLYRYYNYEGEYDLDGPCDVRKVDEDKQFNAVLLSHAHMDHYGYFGLLRDDIPIYLSEISNKIMELYYRTGRTKFNETIKHLLLKELIKNSEEQIGDFRIKRFDMDHSIIGASSYFVEGKTNLVYTGDFRIHGMSKHLTEEFLGLMEKEEIDFLLCEGTRLGLGKDKEEKVVEDNILNSEEDVKAKCLDVIGNEDNLVIYDSSQADLERVKILSQVAKKTGRELLIDSKKAFLLLNLNENKNLLEGLPGIDDFKILLGRSKLSGNTKNYKNLTQECPEFFLETFNEGRRNHERELLDDKSISKDKFVWGPNLRDEILQHPNEYIIYTSNGSVLLLHCKRPKEEILGTYIYGKAEPFTEEMGFSYTRLLKWLKLCNLKMEFAHISGHAFPDDLKKAVEKINPRYLIPIHSEHPEEYEKMVPKGVKILYPELNSSMILK